MLPWVYLRGEVAYPEPPADAAGQGFGGDKRRGRAAGRPPEGRASGRSPLRRCGAAPGLRPVSWVLQGVGLHFCKGDGDAGSAAGVIERQLDVGGEGLAAGQLLDLGEQERGDLLAVDVGGIG